MIKVYGIPLTCLGCGEDVEPVTAGVPIAGSEVNAICRCMHCNREWEIKVFMRAMNVAEHGTNPGYLRHRRNGEIACDDCRAAHVVYVQDHEKRKGSHG